MRASFSMMVENISFIRKYTNILLQLIIYCIAGHIQKVHLSYQLPLPSSDKTSLPHQAVMLLFPHSAVSKTICLI